MSLLGPPAGGCIRKASTHLVWEPLKSSGLGFYDGLRAGLVTSVDALNLQTAGGTCAFKGHNRERRKECP